MESSQSTVVVRVSLNPTTVMSACNGALTKYDERYLKTHLEDFKNDPELKSFNEMMKNRSKVLIEKFKEDGGLSLEFLDGALRTMTDYEEGTTNIVVLCRSQLPKADYSYEVVLKEYLESTSEMLQFCTDTEKFIDEARRIHSVIEEKVEECTKFGMKPVVGMEEARKISDLLNDIMVSGAEDKDNTTQKLGERVEILLKKQGELLDRVIQLLEKLKEKEDKKSASFLGKFLNYLYTGLKFIVLLAATIHDSIAKLLKDSIPPFREVYRIFCWILEEDEPADEDKLNSMKGGALHSLREVGDIQDAINSVNNSITSLLETARQFTKGEIVSAAFKNIKKMLDKFSNKIDDMEERIEECRTRTRKSRRRLA